MRTTVHGIRDGLLFLLGLSVLIMVILLLSHTAQDEGAYKFMIRFPRAQSIAAGAAVHVSGVPVGQVLSAALEPGSNMSLVTVKVNNSVRLRTSDMFALATGGLVGERYIDITPLEGAGKFVEPDMIVDGVTPPDAGNLIANTNKLLAKLDIAANGLNNLVGDAEMMEQLKMGVADFQRSATASAELTELLNAQMKASGGTLAETIVNLRNTTSSSAEFAAGLTALLRRHEGDFDATLVGLRQTSTSTAEMVAGLNSLVQRNAEAVDLMVADLGGVTRDIRQISTALSPQIAGTKAIANLDAASENVVKLTKRLESAAGAVDVLLNDKELAATIRDSAAHLRKVGTEMEALMVETRKATGAMLADAGKATAALPEIAGDMKAATANLRDASAGLKGAGADLPHLTGPFREVTPGIAKNLLSITEQLNKATADVSGATQKLTDMRTFFAGIRIEPEGRVVALDVGPKSTRADANVDIRAGSNLLRLGLANIDNGNDINAQAGRALRPDLWARFGSIQSRWGTGLDYIPGRNFRLTGELFAPQDPRANILASYRLSGPWWLSAGWYDAMDARRSTVGGGIMYRP